MDDELDDEDQPWFPGDVKVLWSIAAVLVFAWVVVMIALVRAAL